MKQKIVRRARKPTRSGTEERWATLLEDDIVGIDGDIDRLIRLYQSKHGCTRDKANAALVMRFLCLAGAGAPLLEDSC